MTYTCEGCGTQFSGTPEQAFDEGWDTPERFMSHCTCPHCTIDKTAWWKLMILHEELDQEAVARIASHNAVYEAAKQTLEGGVTIEALDAGMLGRWLVTTRGSTHIWDIRPDGVLYQRNPGQASASFIADGTEVRLTRVDRWPAVGDTAFIWFDDPDMPDLVEQWRQSSTVQTITRLPDPLEATP